MLLVDTQEHVIVDDAEFKAKVTRSQPFRYGPLESSDDEDAELLEFDFGGLACELHVQVFQLRKEITDFVML